MEYWLKLYVKFLEWEWYKDTNTKSMFLHLLLTANRKEARWQGIEVKRGQLITSLKSLSEKTGLSISQVKLTIDKLKRTNEITNESHSNYRLITLKNYDRYQENNKQPDKRTTNEQQTDDKRATTIGEGKRLDIKKERRNTYDENFEKFWNLYPNKVAKQVAFRAWGNLSLSNREVALMALPAHIESPQWQKDGGQFIPHPATWLNQSRYLDEITTFTPTIYAA